MISIRPARHEPGAAPRPRERRGGSCPARSGPPWRQREQRADVTWPV